MQDVAAFTRHGGALDVARRMFPHAPQPWLDLSTGINPIAYPVGALLESAWTRLPEATTLQRLEAAAARRYGAPPGWDVVAAPGTQAIIQRLPVLCKGADVRVLGRTYGEFAPVFVDFKRAVRTVPRLEALAGADVAVVVNPNNPDGRLIAPPELLALSQRVGVLVVDEAFADPLSADPSVIPRASGGRTIVLRSFGKTYGLPGLRLGFAVAAASLAARLRRLLGPWPVSGPALAIGAAALGDDTWLDIARERLAGDAARLMFLLRQAGATFVGGALLFTLVSHPAAQAMFTTLAEAGILTRPFAEEPMWLRFGLPGPEPDWARLQAALARFR